MDHGSCSINCIRLGLTKIASMGNNFRFVLAKISMLLGAIGCIGAWFEKKILLFIVIQSHEF